MSTTFVRSRYAELWTVTERLKEVFVWNVDVTHPVEQILCPPVVQSKLDELVGHCHVC